MDTRWRHHGSTMEVPWEQWKLVHHHGSESTDGSVAPWWCIRLHRFHCAFHDTAFPWCFHGGAFMVLEIASLAIPWDLYDACMGRSWGFHGASMGLSWFFRGCLRGTWYYMVLLWNSRGGTPVVPPSDFHVASMALLWWFTSMVFL